MQPTMLDATRRIMLHQRRSIISVIIVVVEELTVAVSNDHLWECLVSLRPILVSL